MQLAPSNHGVFTQGLVSISVWKRRRTEQMRRVQQEKKISVRKCVCILVNAKSFVISLLFIAQGNEKHLTCAGSK